MPKTLNASNVPNAAPTFVDSLPGALIDSARITTGAALALLPDTPPPILLATEDEEAEEAALSVQGCLTQAMQWLDAARVLSIQEPGAPAPTSIHVVQDMPAGLR